MRASLRALHSVALLLALLAIGAPPASASTAPLATTQAATEVSLHEATLHATINPGGLKTTYQFEYTDVKDFEENGYANAISVPAFPKEAGSGGEGVEVSETIEGLAARTRYRYQVIASSAEGTAYGASTYKSSFGSSGTGNGQFNVLTDVAVDPTDGSVWVADDGNDRIQHFSAAGEYLGKFASCYDPGAVEVNSAGDVFVACASAQLLHKYNDKGEFLKKVAGYGSGNGQVHFPLDLALDSEENLWVADTENDRIQEFDDEGKFVQAISLGAWSRPWGVDVGANGNVWVAEKSNRRVSVFGEEGELLFRFGSAGTGNGQFEQPVDVEIDENGYAWVADAVNDRIQVFNGEGEYVTQFGEEGSGEGQIDTDWWLRIALGDDGEVWITDQGNARVQRWSPSSFETTTYIPTYKSSFGSSGTGNGQFNVLTDVAVDPTDGSVWVADDGNDRIQHFSAAGEYLGKFASCYDPGAVEVNSAGDVFVACASAQLLHKYNDKGEFLKKVAGYGSGNGQVHFPLDLALDSEENLWVADTENDRIQEFDDEGKFVQAISLGAWSRPWGVDVGANGNVWVAEKSNRRVSVFGEEGELLFRFGSAGTGNGQFEQPVDVEIDENGYAWVADAVNDRIQVFNGEGEYVTQFGEEGSGEGQIDTDWWLRIALGDDGEVWITDQGNARVQRWLHGAVPVATTKPASSIAEDEVTLNAVVNPEGLKTAYQFEYTNEADFKANGYANAVIVPGSPKSIGSGTKDIEVNEVIDDLEVGTTYFFRITAENSAGSTNGADETFTSDGLVAAYSFDENEGDVVHDEIGDHDGTVEGTEWVRDGKYGSALIFDGNSSQVTITDSNDLDLIEAFTLEAWVRPHFRTSWPTIFAKEDSAEPFYSYLLYADSFSEAPHSFFAGAGSAEEDFAGEAAAPPNTWTHVALTSDGSQAKLYVNGELDSSHASLPVRSSDGPLRIGGFDGAEEYFDGRIDEVRIYDQVLTAGQIQRDRDTALESPSAPSGPIAAYPLDEGEGEVAHDIARDHDGVIEGAEWVAGKFGGALRFDEASEDNITIPPALDLDFTTAFTLEAWVRPDVSKTWQPAIFKESKESFGYALYAGGEESGVPEGLISAEEEGRVQAKEAIPAEAWSHIALTLDGESLRLYVEGELVETVAAAGVQSSDGSLRVGGANSLEHYFNGLIDEIRIYDRALSEKEIAEDRDMALGGPQVSLSGSLFEGSLNQLVSPDSTLTVDVHDGGKELAQIELLTDGEVERQISIDEALADGATQECTGTACHLTYSFSAAAANDIPAGPHVIGVRVSNAEGQSTTRSKTVTFDTEPPELHLSGELAEADGGVLEEGEAELFIEVEDGEGELDSGVEEVRVTVDGEIALAEPLSCEPTCPEPATAEFLYDKDEWGEGPHKVGVYAFDAAGNEVAEFVLVDAVHASIEPTCSSGKPSSVEPVESISAEKAQELLEEEMPGAVGKNQETEVKPKIFLDPFWGSGEEFFFAREAFTDGRLSVEPGGSFTIGSGACLVPTASTSAETDAIPRRLVHRRSCQLGPSDRHCNTHDAPRFGHHREL
jgi:tripartite motif-containing protein 71